MNVLVTGASGFVGAQVCRALLERGHRVVPVSRRHGLDLMDFRTPEAWKPLVSGVDAIVNAVGIIGETRQQSFNVLHREAPIALFRAAMAAGVRRVVQLSALGADSSAFSQFHRTRRDADDCLRNRDLCGFVLRPSMIFGSGGTSAEVLLRMAALARIPVLGEGAQPVQPVHIGDVVDVVLRCVCGDEAGRTLDLVGPQTMRFADWMRRLRQAQRLPPAELLRVPRALAYALTTAAGAWSPLARLENLRMLDARTLGDPEEFTAFMGHPPRALTVELIAQALFPNRREP